MMIIDITGIELTPGNEGIDCLGDGNHFDSNGDRIECCCNECDYLICCTNKHSIVQCKRCTDKNCPHYTIKGL